MLTCEQGDNKLQLKNRRERETTMAQSDIKEQFVKELKEAYIARFSNIQPLPLLGVVSLSVRDKFTEGRIECLSISVGDTEQWERLVSYKTLRSDPRIKSNRRIIEGEPGYGKSVLTLQLAHDWSIGGGEGSFLNDVEILILLQLRQLDAPSSIYECIKQFILSKTTTLKVHDIRHILSDTSSVLLVFDGVDEYPCFDKNVENDIIAIMKNEMFQKFEVVLTARSPYSPGILDPDTKRIRLSGFDELSQDKYLRKLCLNEDEDNAEMVKESLHDNPTLLDLCRNPFFFVAYSNLLYLDDSLLCSTTLTTYFEQMILCFRDHFKRKMDDISKPIVSVDTDDDLLNKVAFETLNTRGMFGKDYLCNTLGNEIYNEYIQIGILREIYEHGKNYSESEFGTQVKFIHAMIRDWYAAKQLVDIISNSDCDPNNEDDDFLVEILDAFYPHNFQNLYRFACGINLDVAKRVINYMKNIDGYDQFSIICILEQLRTNDTVLDNIRDLCSESLHISETSTKLWQRSILQILALANQHKITVCSLVLMTVIDEVDSSGNEIVLKSGLHIPTQNTLEKLQIEMTGSEWSEKNVQSFFKYASKCEKLKTISLANFVLPNRINDVSYLSELREKGVKVLWYPTYISCRLNLQSGTWEHTSSGISMTDGDVAKLNDLCRATNSC